MNAQAVIGSEPRGAWSHGEVSRVVAFPLRSGPENLGVLVAGIRRGCGLLSTLERLELRAGLAASALPPRKQNGDVIQFEARQKAAAEASAAAGRSQSRTRIATVESEDRAGS